MGKYMEAPFALYLPQEQYDRLRTLADHRGTSITGLIGAAVEQMLANTPDDVAELVCEWQSAAPWPADRPIEEDPLWGIVGLVDAEVASVAESHDRYTTEMTPEENNPCPERSL